MAQSQRGAAPVQPTPQTARLKLREARDGHHACTYRIEMNIIARSGEMEAVFHEQRFVTPLENVTVLPMKPSQARREGRLQPVHAFDQVWLRSFQGQMEVISHNHVGMHPPAELCRRLAQGSSERANGARCDKNIMLQVAAVDNVIPGSAKLDA